MNEEMSKVHQIVVRVREALAALPTRIDPGEEHRMTLLWVGMFFGLLVNVSVQSVFIGFPVWSRALPPEVDDSMAYLVKTAQMESCFSQGCRALEDLREQIEFPIRDRHIWRERSLVIGRVFQVYHPLFSLMLLGVSKFGLTLITAYKVLWSLGPLFFGIAFAYFLIALWGVAPAGPALALLGFTVFPSNGLHYLVPSNLAMGMAVIVWARIISRRGDAPWALVIGTLLMCLMHPMGRIYSVIAVVIALTVFGMPRVRKVWLASAASILLVGLAFVLPRLIERPMVAVRMGSVGPGEGFSLGLLKSLEAIWANIISFETALFGSFVFFAGAVMFGYLTLEPERRRVILRTTVILAAFLVASVYYVLPAHPGDLFLRLWIPFLVLLFGGMAQAIWYTVKESWAWGLSRLSRPGEARGFAWQRDWPIIAFVLLTSFALRMTAHGVDGMYATAEYMRTRQPLAISSGQPRVLLSQAQPTDSVLYTSTIIMPFYFVNGAMNLGAVFYPALKGTEQEQRWMQQPGLRFAVAYNPMVELPALKGVPEEKWWISSPALRTFVWANTRNPPQVCQEGRIRLDRFLWVQIEPEKGNTARPLRVLIQNPAKDSHLKVVVFGQSEQGRSRRETLKKIPAKWSGWITLDNEQSNAIERFRISRPPGNPSYWVAGIAFGDDKLHWPWAEKAVLTFVPRQGDTTPITVKFDPTNLVPPPLNARNITVLDDSGSSVLLRADE